MSKRITDKERLDWMNTCRNTDIVVSTWDREFQVWPNNGTEVRGSGQSIRQAIDAAIRASRKSKENKNGR